MNGLVNLRWSHDPPKEPGFYWWRMGGINARVLNINRRIADNWTDLWCIRSGYEPVKVADMSIDGEWYGPIYEPIE